MKIYQAECLRDMSPFNGKCYRMTLELHLDSECEFKWNIMCYERPGMMQMIESGDVVPRDDWQVTVKDFPEDMPNVISMLKQKIMMSIEESFDRSMRDYKRFIMKS